MKYRNQWRDKLTHKKLDSDWSRLNAKPTAPHPQSLKYLLTIRNILGKL